MSKHPIPDWLRSQFSRIEDDVRKLGPCGVFTQMRTVTQTYFEQQAAAPQPPALGGEAAAIIGSLERFESDGEDFVKLHDVRDVVQVVIAPLQAEIGRWKSISAVQADRIDAALELAKEHREERDQLKARCDELEHRAADVVEGLDGEELPGSMTMRIRKLKAALSKPAGSECCTPTDEERALLAAGDCTPEELWGGPRPTCPKCIKPAGGESRELLPCPFCGSDESLQIEHLEGTVRHPAFRVRCDNCGASTGYTDTGHIEAWNTRAQPADQQGEPVVLPTDWRSLADQLQEVGLAYWKAHDSERDRGAVKFLHNEETGALFVVTRGEYADQLKDFIFSLDCPAQPATAKVVLPERTTDTQSCSDVAKRIGLYGSVNVWQLGEIWNACLDEVAKLNGINT